MLLNSRGAKCQEVLRWKISQIKNGETEFYIRLRCLYIAIKL
jgi:hypothetical protein